MNAAIREAGGTQRAVAFGSLVDLARLQVGRPSAQICDACNTINMGSAHSCKCCSYKLPAFCAPTKDNTKGERGTLLPWHSLVKPDRASAMDFVAFAVVINLLVLITASIPIH
ncbi:hypothetical protein QTI24_25455 [Variovorax sp. J22P240]|uniref:hypothetical protein n=1 Tax=unclassified Variovorax TaxID=663243 RepID=UPI002574F17D|nr:MULTISPECIES: hypothetical protein [unclassified Variovorax]MDM0001977.1 hypothetical protein [Variovorax sp. J22P240]MDM0047618.1 hypothetical protein [Variovorax sp. J22R115]